MTTHSQGFLRVVVAPLPDGELELSGETPITGKLESQAASLSKLNRGHSGSPYNNFQERAN
jgi:hypothetical protein